MIDRKRRKSLRSYGRQQHRRHPGLDLIPNRELPGKKIAYRRIIKSGKDGRFEYFLHATKGYRAISTRPRYRQPRKQARFKVVG